MSVKDYQIKNIYRYSRRTFKNSKNGEFGQDDDISDSPVEIRTRNEEHSPPDNCHCVVTAGDKELTKNILHKKCPVIDLAQHQLQKLLEDTDTFLHNNNRQGCRSIYEMLTTCREIIINYKYECVLTAAIIMIAFVNGVILGAASCGHQKGRLNSPILSCIESRFMSYVYSDGQYSIT